MSRVSAVRLAVGQRLADRTLAARMLRFDGKKRLPGTLTGGAFFTLPPAPPPRHHQAGLIDKDHLARRRLLDCGVAQVGKALVTGSKADGDSARDRRQVKGRYG